MSTDAAPRRRKLRWPGRWTMLLATATVTPLMLVAAMVAARYLTEAEVATRVVREAKVDDVIQRTLDVTQLVGAAVGYLDGLRRSGWR